MKHQNVVFVFCCGLMKKNFLVWTCTTPSMALVGQQEKFVGFTLTQIEWMWFLLMANQVFLVYAARQEIHKDSGQLYQHCAHSTKNCTGDPKQSVGKSSRATDRMSTLYRNPCWTSTKKYILDPRLLPLARSMPRDPLCDPYFRTPCFKILYRTLEQDLCVRILYNLHLTIPCNINASGFPHRIHVSGPSTDQRKIHAFYTMSVSPPQSTCSKCMFQELNKIHDCGSAAKASLCILQSMYPGGVEPAPIVGSTSRRTDALPLHHRAGYVSEPGSVPFFGPTCLLERQLVHVTCSYEPVWRDGNGVMKLGAAFVGETNEPALWCSGRAPGAPGLHPCKTRRYTVVAHRALKQLGVLPTATAAHLFTWRHGLCLKRGCGHAQLTCPFLQLGYLP